MSFGGGGGAPPPQPAPAPVYTPPPAPALAAPIGKSQAEIEAERLKKRGTAKRGTMLTGAGLKDEAQTTGKTLLGS